VEDFGVKRFLTTYWIRDPRNPRVGVWRGRGKVGPQDMTRGSDIGRAGSTTRKLARGFAYSGTFCVA
jgi:hypothetical protein